MSDPFAAKRSAMRAEFFDKLFLLGGWIGGTDTYKRTMWAAVPEIAVQRAAYSLTFRRSLPEPGADGRMVMAGHEAMLAQWFRRPLKRSDIELSREWYSQRSNVRVFPAELWDSLVPLSPGGEGLGVRGPDSSTSPLEGEVGEPQASRVEGSSDHPPPANSCGVDDLPLKGGGVPGTPSPLTPLPQGGGEQDICLPIDIWGFPGGQTFLAGVPLLVFEGPGGLVSYLEPAMCRYFAPVIQATKARLMKLATPRDAEFGLRSAPVEVCNLILLLARYVGGGGQLTSNDTAEFLYPELFKSIGTIGHEMMCAAQSFDRTLAEAEYEMMDRYVSRMGSASLLCDLVDAETVGLENALRVIRNHPETDRVGVRVDSGDIAGQCVLYFEQMKRAGIPPRMIVFEDEVTPDQVKKVYDVFRERTGEEPTMLFPGAGGYWWRLVHRDTVSAAFKRTATGDRPNVKFSNSPGKESIPGYLRVYGRGEVMLVADKSESIDGDPLFVKLVQQGRIVYAESFQEQAARADRTWGRFKRVELSPLVGEYMDRFRRMRAAEVAEARKRLGG